MNVLDRPIADEPDPIDPDYNPEVDTWLDRHYSGSPGECPECLFPFTDLEEGCDACIGSKEGMYLAVGTRVELHPATDWWMRGAKYGVVIAQLGIAPWSYRIKLDKGPNITVAPRDIIKGFEA